MSTDQPANKSSIEHGTRHWGRFRNVRHRRECLEGPEELGSLTSQLCHLSSLSLSFLICKIMVLAMPYFPTVYKA